MKRRNKVLILVLMLVFFSCDVLDEVQQTVAFTKCKFRLHSVENLKFAGVNIQNKDELSDVGFTGAAKIASSVAQGKFPLDFDLNIQVKNPNSSTASMHRMEWQLYIDNMKMLQGNVDRRISVNGNGGVNTFPLRISTDVKELLNENSKDAVINLIFNLAGVGGRPSNIMVKAKPSIEVGGTMLDYPGYITIRNEFTSN
ncbi:MAG: hypothetical protein K9I94_11600 [Bacteroidales bacterium]|nr:hypothetical protein [Bacteroidales bacterium]